MTPTYAQELHLHLQTAVALYAAHNQAEAEYHYIRACDLLPNITDPMVHYTAWVRCEYVNQLIMSPEEL